MEWSLNMNLSPILGILTNFDFCLIFMVCASVVSQWAILTITIRGKYRYRIRFAIISIKCDHLLPESGLPNSLKPSPPPTTILRTSRLCSPIPQSIGSIRLTLTRVIKKCLPNTANMLIHYQPNAPHRPTPTSPTQPTQPDSSIRVLPVSGTTWITDAGMPICVLFLPICSTGTTLTTTSVPRSVLWRKKLSGNAANVRRTNSLSKL